eukprot:441981_1
MTTFHFVSAIISLIITVTHMQSQLIHHNQKHHQLMPSIHVYDLMHSKTSNYVSHNTSPIESYTVTSTNELHKTKYIFDNPYQNYMHLTPTSTMISLENWLNTININKDTNKESHVSLKHYAHLIFNTVNKLLNKLNNTNDMYIDNEYYYSKNDGQYMNDTDYDNYMDENIVYGKYFAQNHRGTNIISRILKVLMDNLSIGCGGKNTERWLYNILTAVSGHGQTLHTRISFNISFSYACLGGTPWVTASIIRCKDVSFNIKSSVYGS